MHKFIYGFCLAISLLIVSSCSNKENNPKTASDSGKPNIVNVQIQEIKKHAFSNDLVFNSNLKGIQEATIEAEISDKIQKINFKPGDDVKQADVIVEFPSNTPAVQYLQSKTALENSEKSYQRMLEQKNNGQISQQDFANTENQYKLSKSNFDKLKKMVFVESPIDGVVAELFVKKGEKISAKQKLFTIAQTEQMKAEIQIGENEKKQLKKGMPAYIKVNNKEIKGKISSIAEEPDPTTRNYALEIVFNNKNNDLKYAEKYEIRIKLYENEDAIVIPKILLMNEGSQKYVFVIENSAAQKRYVKIGSESALEAEIIDGLTPGDKIVVKGYNLLENGTTVKIEN